MAGITKTQQNKLSPNESRVIYMDAGVWGGPEKGMPRMTFGLMEHNAIALCTFFSYGQNVPLPQLPELGYNFHNSHMSTFLDIMMKKKYGIKPKPNDPLKGFHILKIFPFRKKELLDNTAELRIFVPDLHLHFFKDTYLDNFVTQYGNKYSSSGISPVRLNQRASMEDDFSIFLETIAEFQKSILPKTYIYFLGDMCEMWETESIIRYYQSDAHAKKYYELLDKLGKWVLEVLEKSPATQKDARFRTLRGYVRELTKTTLTSTRLDSETKKQLNAVYKSSNWQQFLFEPDENKEVVRKKAKAIQKKILDKHRDRNGRNFTSLLDDINWKYYIGGNHDNYIKGVNEANNTFLFGSLELKPHLFRVQYSFENCALFYGHGHNMDYFNNDEACALGRIITCLLTFYELKRRGDLVRKFEGVFRSKKEVRLDYVKKISRICYLWEKNDRKYQNKNKVVILAHTHAPDLVDMSNEFRIWKWSEDAWGKPQDKREKHVRRF